MNKFDTKATALTSLLYNKKPDCVEALTREFDLAINEGFNFREAYWRAEITHFLKDHDGYNHLPELTIPDTYESVKTAILTEIRPGNEEDKDLSERLLKWFELFLHWSVPVSLAFVTAMSASKEEWEEENDIDEAEAIRKIEEVPVDNVRELLFRTFYAARNRGNTTISSLRIARDKAEEALRMEAIMSMLSGGGLAN